MASFTRQEYRVAKHLTFGHAAGEPENLGKNQAYLAKVSIKRLMLPPAGYRMGQVAPWLIYS
jgi:hypothetical protein